MSRRAGNSALARRVMRNPDSLVCALALDPSLLSRNRNFALYTAPAMRRAHGRAVSLRALARDIASWSQSSSPVLHLIESPGGVELGYRCDALALTRRVPLDPLELSVLKVLVARRTLAAPALLRTEPCDLRRVSEALTRIGIGLRASPDPARCA